MVKIKIDPPFWSLSINFLSKREVTTVENNNVKRYNFD